MLKILRLFTFAIYYDIYIAINVQVPIIYANNTVEYPYNYEYIFSKIYIEI